MAIILDGKKVATEIKRQIALAVQEQYIQPLLATVLVGEDPASMLYVRNKRKDCQECGFNSYSYTENSNISEKELVALVNRLSADSNIDGILVQLPLPTHIAQKRVIQAIDPAKDVDCFTPQNAGLLFQGHPRFNPCTPGGIIELLKYYGVHLSGKRCVIVGRSNIVGKPMAALALQNNATVTICHSHTENLSEICESADILISAIGQRGFITPSMIKSGVVLVDVGINRDPDGKLCGDCSPDCYEKVFAYTPVPGGVGQMTRAMLMLNIALAAGLKIDLTNKEI